MKWYLEVLKKYAQFSGRSRRKEFWWFWGFDTAISPLLALVDLVLFGDVLVRFHGLGPIAALYWVALVIPRAAVATRRLHDTGRSGWWGVKWLAAGFCLAVVARGLSGSGEMGPAALVGVLLVGIAFLTWVIYPLFVLVRGSQPGDNKYGPNPISVAAQAVDEHGPGEASERDDESKRAGPTRWS